MQQAISEHHTFICGKLCSFVVRKKNRRCVRLETSDGFGTAGLADSINGLTDAHTDRQRLEVFVDCQQHTWHHGRDETV
jgi:hypothetical protein